MVLVFFYRDWVLSICPDMERFTCLSTYPGAGTGLMNGDRRINRENGKKKKGVKHLFLRCRTLSPYARLKKKARAGFGLVWFWHVVQLSRHVLNLGTKTVFLPYR